MTKILRKAITCRSQLESKYLKTKTQTHLTIYKNHENLCSKLYKRERRKYYESLDMKNILDSNKHWKTMRPFLFDKNTIFSQNCIEKNNRIISDDFDLSEELSIFFDDAVKSLNVKPDDLHLSDTENLSDPLKFAIRKFEKHPSFQAIKQNISVKQYFYFSNTEARDILKETTSLSSKKTGTLKYPSNTFKKRV